MLDDLGEKLEMSYNQIDEDLKEKVRSVSLCFALCYPAHTLCSSAARTA